MAPQFVPLALLLPLLVMVALGDLRGLQIPKHFVVLCALLFAATSPMLGTAELAARLVSASVAFVICFGLFAGRIIGGGDAKFFPVLIMFVPSNEMSHFMMSLAAGLSASVIALQTARAYMPSDGLKNWRGLQRGEGFPMGVAFLAATLIFFSIDLSAVG